MGKLTKPAAIPSISVRFERTKRVLCDGDMIELGVRARVLGEGNRELGIEEASFSMHREEVRQMSRADRSDYVSSRYKGVWQDLGAALMVHLGQEEADRG